MKLIGDVAEETLKVCIQVIILHFNNIVIRRDLMQIWLWKKEGADT